ncbi:MAG: hypothetical protein C0481_18670 [Phenylobacterium sp.]|uniref:hypothetical protein n=1 Tax=Phenylobacterium sp. TaxID=1871053 RepID=UPI0025D91816|nr:hypothetical protein [Phenylobacterium sp.]MBA4013889.1 hypothetical protein [Phenylobacterium sp.]
MDLQACCFATQLLGRVEFNAGVAAWAQAIGGLAAIWVAYLVGQLPAKQAREARKAEQIAFCETLKRAAQFTFSTYSDAFIAADKQDWLAFRSAIGAPVQAKTDGLIVKALEEPLSNWPSGELYLATQMFAFATGLVAEIDGRPLGDSEGDWNQQLRVAAGRLTMLDAAKVKLDDEIAAAVLEIRKGRLHAGLPSAETGM